MAKRREVVQWIAGTSATVAAPLLLSTGCREETSAGPKANKQVPAAAPTTDHAASATVAPAAPGSQLITPAAALRVPVKHFDIRRSGERGRFKLSWLDAKHSFSFGRYYDPKHMGFRSLRVLNEDKIKPGGGFPMHPHDNMEIITYILGGALQHRDSIGGGDVIRPGEIQRMSAGTGIQHSEFNPSSLEPVHLLQIWLAPNKRGHKPSYSQQVIPQTSSPNPIRLIVSPDGENGSVSINQDARIYACHIARGQELAFEVKKDRHAWLQMAKGNITIKSQVIRQGDAISSSDDGWILAYANEPSEILIFDLA